MNPDCLEPFHGSAAWVAQSQPLALEKLPRYGTAVAAAFRGAARAFPPRQQLRHQRLCSSSEHFAELSLTDNVSET